MDMKKTVTIYDIAREAGVSPATVSRILTGSAMVNLEKRERVLKLIQRYDFHPNNAARSLTEKRSRMLGILTVAPEPMETSQILPSRPI